MRKMNFEEFAVEAYSKNIYNLLCSLVESKDLRSSLSNRDYSSQKEIKANLKFFSKEIAIKYIEALKSKGFPGSQISEDEQKSLLKEVVNEYISKKRREFSL